MEINLCLVYNEVSLSLFFQAFPVLLRPEEIQSKMHDICCSSLFTLSYLGFFLVCWVAEDIRGKEEGRASKARPEVAYQTSATP